MSCLACIASYLLKWFLLSWHKQLWICHAVLIFVLFHPGIMCLPYIKVVIVTIMHEWVLKSELYCFFLSVLLDNSNSIKRKEVSKAADEGAPSKWRASTDSTPPSPQDDFQDNKCIDTQRSCVGDEHVSPSAPVGERSNFKKKSYAHARSWWCIATRGESVVYVTS